MKKEKTASKWSAVDWKKRDVDIAEEMGVTRERVRQVRKDLHKPKSPLWHKRIATSKMAILQTDTAKMTPKQVAKSVGCGTIYARQVLDCAGKAYVKPPDGRRQWKYDWNSVTKEEWTGLTDAQIAQKLGVKNPAVVTQWRIRKGITKPDRRFAKSGVTTKATKVKAAV
jgi:hypothetical protein